MSKFAPSGLAVSTLLLLVLQMPVSSRAQSNPTNNQQIIQQYYISPKDEPTLSAQQIATLLRQNIKYVFILYQENRSFDSYFGTYPGVEGLFTSPPDKTPGFYQTLLNIDGSSATITPFRIGPSEYAADTDDVDHSHARMVAKMNVVNNTPRMDQFASVEEQKYVTNGTVTLKAKQYGELTMAYEDCDTIPLLWQYASRFVLFDHIFQYFTGPSTPGNIAIMAAQSGNTQWALHPDQAYQGNGNSGTGVPVSNDADPFWGSQADTTPAPFKLPANPPSTSPQINLTFASLPLTLMGGNLASVTQSDLNPASDLADVKQDVTFITNLNRPTVPFGWYEEGFNKENTDPDDSPATHASYITHHNGPQYFGYIANNPQMAQNLHGLGDFFSAVDNKTLPVEGGVFWVKGGLKNTLGLKPAMPDPKVQANFLGDDDHPAYSDAQISEALVAEAINKIAASGYWANSAIIITWDDSEGDYDHLPPPVVNRGPDGSVTTDGPRVPFILLSPFSKTNYISKQVGNQVSAIRFINTIFNLPPLATLPDEVLGAALGKKLFKQDNLGPQDGTNSGITDLLDAFSPSRLLGNTAPLPTSYVQIPENLVRNIPQSTGYGCSNLGIVTTDRALGIPNNIPSDFNPRPGTLPTPTSASAAVKTGGQND
ncbi:MAG: phosphoesterase [Acidobacteriaceae bacterium]|nr:phosphoesterase [Acidobacteriaceae bacterium]